MPRDDETAVIQGWLDRLQAGDESAREALLASASGRLTRLAHRMLKGHPGVRRWEETDDLLQNALVRLDRALRTVRPPTVLDFIRLAATMLRRELIDLARHYHGPMGLGTNHDSQGEAGPAAPHDTTHDPGRLVGWAEFHRRVEGLPPRDREVFDLIWYQGLTQVQSAVVLGVSERTVHTRWLEARLKLREALGGQLPV
jgi:RNA polymerase sigma-70 factor (ECF subfamily)